MKSGRMILLTGSPGTGKTTVSSILARESALEKSAHMHTDDFYTFLSKGMIPPYLPGSGLQNAVVIEAFLAAAKRFVLGGYDVIVDGVIGPWALSPWKSAAEEGYEVHYIVLRAGKEETLRRAVGRSKLDAATNTQIVERMWDQFCRLGEYERNVIDTTDLSVDETVSLVQMRIAEKSALL